jgi:hypothetical protein
MGGEERKIAIINISMTGVLAELCGHEKDMDIKAIFNILRTSTLIDLYLPEMRLAGEAEVVRADLEDNHILLALEFKNIAFDIDENLNKRKAYRKSMPDSGLILLDDGYHAFNTVNVSVDGLMIQLLEPLAVKEGAIVRFSFKKLDLQGEARVIWADPGAGDGTLIGLKYINMNIDSVISLPRFAEARIV